VKLVIFGLSISSSWGNGHATLWRGLCRALVARGHEIVFFERDVPYYREHRDLTDLPGLTLQLYGDWTEASRIAERELKDADVAMVTSYCPDGVAAGDLVLRSNVRLRAFYDLDTPVTLERLRAGHMVPYIGPRGLRDFDLVLSYTGGVALHELKTLLGAKRVAPLYGSVDPTVHRPVHAVARFEADLSYLGTYAEDRQSALEALFIEPARRRPERRFVIAGAMYPPQFPWTANIFFVRHLPPAEHPAFFSSSRITLNVTRRAMAHMGFCPSGRLFEAAACGTPVLSDWWEGLDHFFAPDRELLVARSTEDAIRALDTPPGDLERMAEAARARTLDEHTAEHRARDLELLFDAALAPLAETAGGELV
jgi:spore maturation protein CgeB